MDDSSADALLDTWCSNYDEQTETSYGPDPTEARRMYVIAIAGSIMIFALVLTGISMCL